MHLEEEEGRRAFEVVTNEQNSSQKGWIVKFAVPKCFMIGDTKDPVTLKRKAQKLRYKVVVKKVSL